MSIQANFQDIPIQIREITRLNNGNIIEQLLNSKILVRDTDYYIEKPIVDKDTGKPTTSVTSSQLPSSQNLSEVVTSLINNKTNIFSYGNLYGIDSESDSRITNTVYPYLSTKVKDEYTLSNIFHYFYNKFFDNSFSDFDVNGYTVTFLFPPDLSGFKRYSSEYLTALLKKENIPQIDAGYIPQFEYLSPDVAFKEKFMDYMMFAVELNINDQDVRTTDIQLASGQSIEYITGFNTSGNISIRYLDNSKLKMYNFHNLWLTYIKMIMRGDLEPDSSYYETKELDYMASLYILKFQPRMDVPNYIGKATGIFPKNLPVNDILGNRTDNQLVMYTMNYFYTMYEGSVLNFVERLNGDKPTPNSISDWKLTQESELFSEFKDLIFSAYRK